MRKPQNTRYPRAELCYFVNPRFRSPGRKRRDCSSVTDPERYESRYERGVTRRPPAGARRRASYASILLATAVGAAAGFALITRAVARRGAGRVDRKVHDETTIREDHPARKVAEAVHPVGKWWTYVPAAALAGTYVLLSRDERPEMPSRLFGTAAILVAATAAAALNETFDELLPQPVAPPGRPTPDHPVFPSGHAFGTSAVALSAAYVLAREGLARVSLVVPVAIAIPLCSSVGRLLEEKHWISDIVAGHLGAITLASSTLALYELAAHANPVRLDAHVLRVI